MDNSEPLIIYRRQNGYSTCENIIIKKSRQKKLFILKLLPFKKLKRCNSASERSFITKSTNFNYSPVKLSIGTQECRRIHIQLLPLLKKDC